MYVALGQLDSALRDYDRAIGLDPENAAAYQNRGIAYLLQGKESEAERDFARCLQLDSGSRLVIEDAVRRINKRN